MLAVGFIPRRCPHNETRRVATIQPERRGVWERGFPDLYAFHMIRR